MEQNSEKKPIAFQESDIRRFMSKNIPFSLDGMKSLNCSGEAERGLKLLTDAIRSARTLETISFDYRYYTLKFTRQIFKALAVNTSVKTLEFYASDAVYQTFCVASLYNMLKDNTTLQTIIISHTKFSLDMISALCDGLKHNKTVRRLSIVEGDLNDDKVELLAEMLLENSGITELELDMPHVDQGFATLFEALQENSKVQKLSLSNLTADRYADHVIAFARKPQQLIDLELFYCLLDDSEGWISFFESLISNTSLTSLKLRRCKLDSQCCSALGDMLKVNTTLKTLEVVDCSIEDEECCFITEALKVNTSLTHLALNENPISTSNLSEVLQINKSLKYLNLDNCCEIDPTFEDFSDALVLNSSLKELHIVGPIRIDGMLNIGQVLEINQSIRILHMGVPLRHDKNRIYFQEFLSSLKYNKTLTELNLRTDKPPQNTDGKLIAETLKSNKAIRILELFGLDTKHDINRWLKRNNKLQHDLKQKTFSVIKMIAMRPETFLSIFPLEVWKLIFDNIKLPGITIQFGELLTDVMTDPQQYLVIPMQTE